MPELPFGLTLSRSFPFVRGTGSPGRVSTGAATSSTGVPFATLSLIVLLFIIDLIVLFMGMGE